MRHGDGLPLGPVPGRDDGATFDETCQIVLPAGDCPCFTAEALDQVDFNFGGTTPTAYVDDSFLTALSSLKVILGALPPVQRNTAKAGDLGGEGTLACELQDDSRGIFDTAVGITQAESDVCRQLVRDRAADFGH
jgi:hypothetical protein